MAEVGGGEVAKQASQTFRCVFGDGLKARKPGDSGRKIWRSFPNLPKRFGGNTQISTLSHSSRCT